MSKGRRFGLGTVVHRDGATSSSFPRDPALLEEIEKLNQRVEEKDAEVAELKRDNIETRQQLHNVMSFIQQQFPNFSQPPQ